MDNIINEDEDIVSLTDDEVSDLVWKSLQYDDILAFPEEGGEYDEDTRVRIGQAVREYLNSCGVDMYC